MEKGISDRQVRQSQCNSVFHSTDSVWGRAGARSSGNPGTEANLAESHAGNWPVTANVPRRFFCIHLHSNAILQGSFDPFTSLLTLNLSTTATATTTTSTSTSSATNSDSQCCICIVVALYSTVVGAVYSMFRVPVVQDWILSPSSLSDTYPTHLYSPLPLSPYAIPYYMYCISLLDKNDVRTINC